MQGRVCRICALKLEEAAIMVDLFDVRKGHLLRQIQSITGLELKNLVSHPKYICQGCLTDLSCCIKFRQRCIISQRQLADKANIPNEDLDTEKVCAATGVGTSPHLQSKLHDEIQHQGDDEDSDSQIERFFIKTEEFLDNDATELGNNANKVGKKPQNTAPYVCDQCGRTVNNLSNFREHLLRHKGIKRFQCSDCQKSFVTKKELIRHRRCHTGEKPYGCSHCSSCFADRAARQEHERRHFNERRYECQECGNRFITSGSLTNHMLIHNAERQHHCATCNRWFLRLTHLQAHTRTETHKRMAGTL